MKITNTKNALFIPLVSDYGFKAVFANDQNQLFLCRALQALIKTSTPIAAISFDKNAFDGIVKDSRGGIYDLACVDEAGNHFIVEMQLSDAPYFFQRMKFYASHKFNSMVLKGNYEYDSTLAINAESIRVTRKAIQDGLQEGLQKATEEAVQDAIQVQNKSAAERMLKQGKLSIEEIADSLAISINDVMKTKSELGL